MRILISEDNAATRGDLERLFLTQGYSVECAANGADALEKARRRRPDIIVSDIMMPEMDGFMLCRRAGEDETLRHIPIVLYSSTFCVEDDHELALSLGAARLIVKPEQPRELLRVIAEVLAAVKAGPAPQGEKTPAEKEQRESKRAKSLLKRLRLKILELEAARRELSKIDGRYAALFKNMLEGVAYCRLILGADGAPADWIHLDTNEAYKDLTGARNVMGNKASEVFPALLDGNTELAAFFGRVAMSGRAEAIDVCVQSLSRWFHISAFCPEQGYFVGIFEDITGRKKAENSLRQLSAIVQESRDAIIGCAPGGEILAWNKGAEKIFGYAAPEILGKSLRDLFLPEHREELPELLSRVRAGQPQTDYITAWTAKNGTRVELELSVSPVHGLDGRVDRVSLVGRDITRRRAAEARQARTDAELRQAQKMEVAGRLANGMAHDFNNILISIFGYSDLVLRALREDDPARADVAEIKRAGERAASLTRQLLSFSRKQVLDFEVLDLNKVVADMKDMLRRLIGEDIALFFLPAGSPALAKADFGQLQQVILNLAVNARDAMPEGGKLRLEVGTERLESSLSHAFGTIPAGTYSTLSAADTGCGMSEEVKAHIFEPFFTTKERDKGTGLGLSTIYGIISQSGGYIEVYSAPALGATFKIYLPQAAPADRTDSPEAAAAKSFEGTATILLVDDDVHIRTVGRRILGGDGFMVLEAGDGQEALEIAAAYGGPIHLMLTDMVMPGMNGHELAGRLARQRPGLKIMFMSGYTEHSALGSCRERGDGIFIQKPFLPGALLCGVRSVLAS